MLILKDLILFLTVSNFYVYISQGLRVGLNLALAISLHNIPEVSSQCLVIDAFCFDVKYPEWMCCTTSDVASRIYIEMFYVSFICVCLNVLVFAVSTSAECCQHKFKLDACMQVTKILIALNISLK